MIPNKPICDWLSLRHRYLDDFLLKPERKTTNGKILRINGDGEIEWETQTWESVRSPSSDTSIRIKCDGNTLWCSGNIGRFERSSNVEGISVMACVERWSEVLQALGFDVTGFGARFRVGTVGECGTYLTRIDLAGNYQTDDYSSLQACLLSRRIGHLMPTLGKYGPMWGFEKGKRGNWYKAKLYDKTAEQNGLHRSQGGATLARFEVQLGSEYLKRHDLDKVMTWKDDDMGKVIYGKFAEQVFRDQISVEDWSQIPVRLRQHAILWRDGVDIRTQVSRASYFRIRKSLLAYGVDVGMPCNVVALSRCVRNVSVVSVESLREAA